MHVRTRRNLLPLRCYVSRAGWDCRLTMPAREKALQEVDHLPGFLGRRPCRNFLKRFRKVGWMSSFPDTCWGRGVLKAQKACEGHLPPDNREAACANLPVGS